MKQIFLLGKPDSTQIVNYVIIFQIIGLLKEKQNKTITTNNLLKEQFSIDRHI